MSKKVALRRKGKYPWFSLTFVVLGSVLMVVPFFDMIMGSFKSPGEYGKLPYHFLPQTPTLSNYAAAFTQLDLGRLFANSIFVTVVVTTSVLLTSAMAGYALAKLRFPGRSVIFRIVLATMMFPPFLLLIPDFLMMVNWPLAGGNDIFGTGGEGLTSTLLALCIPFLVSGFGIFLMRQFMVSIPDELLEAARLDGASEFRIWFSIVLQQAKPTAITLGLLTFIGQWNEYIWTLLISSVNPDLMTLPVGIQLLQSFLDPASTAPIVMAGLVISIIPVLVIFLSFQKYYIRGFVLSGMK